MSQLGREHALSLLYQMLRIRRFEERCVELYSGGKIRGFMHLYIGEEAIAVGVCESLGTEDEVVATYRDHGHALAVGLSMKEILAEMYGKSEGCCRGRGGSMHLFSAEKRFFGGNAIVAGGLPMALGLAMAHKLQAKPGVSVCFFGEGAAAEGEFHESMNLAVLWKLPVLFVCENNLYAMGTALSRSESETEIYKKAAGYGMKSKSVDGMDVSAVEKAAKRAFDYIRSGEGPYFLECKTYRFRAHSMFDPELYRSKEEVNEWKERGPIKTWQSKLGEMGLLQPADLETFEKQIASEISDAIEFAEAGTLEPIEQLMRDVYTTEDVL